MNYLVGTDSLEISENEPYIVSPKGTYSFKSKNYMVKVKDLATETYSTTIPSFITFSTNRFYFSI